MKARQDGFTLVELAIVMVVIALLTAGGLRMIRTLTDLNHATDTRERMARARDALTAYWLRNGRLPCPAEPTFTDTDPNAGKETLVSTPTQGNVCSLTVSDPSGNSAYWGELPWVSLGLPAEVAYDGYNGRLLYAVAEGAIFNANLGTLVSPSTIAGTANFGGVPVPTSAAIPGAIKINNANGNAQNTQATLYAFALLSYGPNGYGAYQNSGQPKTVDTSLTGTGEQTNMHPSTSALTLYESVLASEKPDVFDDRLVYVSADELINKAIAAGMVPSPQKYFASQVERFKQALLPALSYDATTKRIFFDPMSVPALHLSGVAGPSPFLDASGLAIQTRFTPCGYIPVNLTNDPYTACTPGKVMLELTGPSSTGGLKAQITAADLVDLMLAAGMLQTPAQSSGGQSGSSG